jgi:hypothetical protein
MPGFVGEEGARRLPACLPFFALQKSPLPSHAAASLCIMPAPAIANIFAQSIQISSVFFFVAFIWHSALLPTFYQWAGPEVAALIQLSGSHVDAFKDPPVLSAQTLREFGLAGAASHTVVFLFGFLCAVMLRTVRFGKIVSSGGRPEPIGIGVSLVLVVWSAAVFHVMALTFSRYAFETRFGPVYNYATLFYENAGGESPFSWASSVSFTTALIIGFFVSTGSQMSRFQRVFLGPFHQSLGASGAASVIVPFAVWLGLLDRFLMPVGTAVLPSGPSDVVDGSHAFAFAIGLLMMCAGSATKIFADTCCNPEAEKLRDVDEYSQTLDAGNFVTILQTLAMTVVLSSSLMISALFKGEVAASVVWANMWRPVLLSAVLVLLALTATFLLRYLSFSPVEHVLRSRGWLRAFYTHALLLCLWNCHLLPFFGCWVPFHLFAFAHHDPSKPAYTQLNALWDGFLYAFTGPYCAIVLVQGVLKLASTRLKLKWGLGQETFLAFATLIPPTLTVYVRWQQAHPALPVHLVMSLMELWYLLTFRGRPEYTGWREWPALKQSRVWVLLEEYFAPRYIVDGLVDSSVPEQCVGAVPGFEEGRARVLGFHPHGLFPCTMLWSNLVPLWQRVFGHLLAYPLTDAFTHVPPGMREVMQWHGAREITKAVMQGMLRDKHTVIVVPGGQAELLMHTFENHRDKLMVLDAKHRGFIRIALAMNADLVPLISFGELKAIQNVEMPTMQRLTRKIYGFPIPFLPVGVWGILPLPRRTQFTLVFGKPMAFPVAKPGEPTDDEVDVAYSAYFDEVTRLFYAYREAAGWGDWELKLIRGLDRRPSGMLKEE